MNIIFVSGATARARTLTLDWRHLAGGSFALLALFLAFTLIFNYVTLRYAASINHPLLQAIMLADQRQELLGQGIARDRPKSRSGAPGKQNGNDRRGHGFGLALRGSMFGPGIVLRQFNLSDYRYRCARFKSIQQYILSRKAR